ncbi:serine hydrolase [Leptolyngbya sp. PCC 6406]|uniref:serine hydrolase n=1 Tax=Leptolyngbya sp. PCC 6406 TaxID=1173264 RepID=UPI0002AC6912|nr:serine hydrolase [Leptolyngbya sp. PCC 6406]
MGWLWYPFAIAFNTVALTVAAAVVYPTLALAPDEVDHPLLAQMGRTKDIRTLHWLQQQAQRELAQVSPPRLSQDFQALAPYFLWTQVVYRLNQRVDQETTAAADYERALELATQAIITRNQAREEPASDQPLLQQEAYLWQAAIAQLEQISPHSLMAEAAATKKAEYIAAAEPVAVQVELTESDFLKAIAEATGRPGAIRITLCHLSGACRNYQGDVPPASPASLIKLPVAVALMDKVVKEGIDLDQPVYVEPYNWTENANGAKIFVDREYPLREVMARMIKESNNIATNQLADYIGWETMNQTLEERGFPNTTVNTKLAGDSTLPSVNRNSGGGPNTMTSNEVTEMMRQIYTFAHPGDEEILDALVGQYDWDFGYRAVNQLRNKRVAWIGEKTGQNSRVIGSTLAVKIDDERYVMTVTIDNSGNQVMLREVIQGVIQHVLDEGHLVTQNRQ